MRRRATTRRATRRRRSRNERKNKIEGWGAPFFIQPRIGHKMPTIYVFEDGETWSAAPPTAVVLTDEQLQRLIESGGKVQAAIDEDEEDESCVIPKCCDNAEGCDECVSVKSDCECDNECAEKHTCTECHKKGCFCDGIEKCDRCDWAACKECDSEGKQIDEEWVCGSCLLEEEK